MASLLWIVPELALARRGAVLMMCAALQDRRLLDDRSALNRPLTRRGHDPAI
jgi:hypothetical protein